MSKRYPNFRRAQREGGPYRKRSAHSAADGRSSMLNIIGLFVVVIAVAWFATPALHRWWNRAQRSPEETAKIEQSVFYAGCDDARAAGVAPIYAGSPGYREGMHGDRDGIACEPHR